MPGDHACSFCSSDEEHRLVVAEFVRNGLGSGARVLYLTDSAPVDVVAGALRSAGIEVDDVVGRGQLRLLPAAGQEVFDPVRRIALYRSLVDQARTEGYPALWLADLASSGPKTADGAILAYERMIDTFFASTEHAVGLCLYAAGAAPPETFEELRSAHNLEVSATELLPLVRVVPGLRIVPTEPGVAVSGEVDLATHATLWNALCRLVHRAEEAGEAVLDVTDLTFVDAHGAGLIARAAGLLGPGQTLVLRGDPPGLRRVADILRLDREPGLVIEREDRHGGS